MPRKLVVVLALLGIALGITSVVSRFGSFSDDVLLHNDFTQDYVAARAITAGQDPYTPIAELVRRHLPAHADSYQPTVQDRRNPHPPAQVALMRSLVWLPYAQARALWLLLDAVLIAIGAAMCFRAAGLGARASAAVGVATLALPVAQQDLIWGQPGGLLLVLLAIGVARASRGRDVAAGLWLGALAALRFYPLIFLVVFAVRRRFRAAGVLLATFITASLAGVLGTGLEGARTFATVASPHNFSFWRAGPMNLSLPAIPFRWFTQSPWRPDGFDAPVLAWVLAAALIAACVFAAATTPARISGDAHASATGWMVLAAPLAWPFTLLLALPLIARALVPRDGSSVPAAWVMVAAAAVVLAPIPGLPLPAPGFPVMPQVLGYALPTYGLLALVVADRVTARRGAPATMA